MWVKLVSIISAIQFSLSPFFFLDSKGGLRRLRDSETLWKIESAGELREKILQLDEQVEELARELGDNFEIVVLIPVYRKDGVAVQVAGEVMRGLRRYYPEKKALLLVTGEESRRSDFEELFAQINEIAGSEGIKIAGLLKTPQHKGKGWSLRAGLKLARELFGPLPRSGRAFLNLDSDIRNLSPEWIKKFLDPLLEQGKKMVFSTYSMRQYREDERALKDHFVTPLLSSFVNKEFLEAEGEYGFSDSELIDFLLREDKIWSYLYPEFFFIPSATRLGMPIAGVDFLSKDHDRVKDAYPRIPEYARAIFDQIIEYPFMSLEEDVETLVSSSLLNTPASHFINVEPEEHLLRFQEGFVQFQSLYFEVLPPQLFQKLERLASLSSNSEYQFEVEDWVESVFSILQAYAQAEPVRKEELLSSLMPLLILRVGAFAQEVRDKSLEEAYQLLQEQNGLFRERRKLFLKRWLLNNQEVNSWTRYLNASSQGESIPIQIYLGRDLEKNLLVPAEFLREDSYRRLFIRYLAGYLHNFATLYGLQKIFLQLEPNPYLEEDELIEELSPLLEPKNNTQVLKKSEHEEELGKISAQELSPEYYLKGIPQVKGTFLGVDIGASQIKFQIIKDNAVLTIPAELSLISSRPEEGARALLERVKEGIRKLIAVYGEFDGIGIGIPGTVDLEKEEGIDFGLLSRNWDEEDIQEARKLVEELEEEFSTRVILRNDRWGFAQGIIALQEVESFLVIALGSGPGIQPVRDGFIFRNPMSNGLPVLNFGEEGELRGVGYSITSEGMISRAKEAGFSIPGKEKIEVEDIASYLFIDYLVAADWERRNQLIAREILGDLAEKLAEYLIGIGQLLDLPPGFPVFLAGGVLGITRELQNTTGAYIAERMKQVLSKRGYSDNFEIVLFNSREVVPQFLGAYGNAILALRQTR